MASSWTKKDLVDRMAEEADIPKTRAEKALDGFVGAVEEAMEAGEKVTLMGFGSFSVQERKGRPGRNPQTGERIHIPARTVPKFKAGKHLKEAAKSAPGPGGESGGGGGGSQPSWSQQGSF